MALLQFKGGRVGGKRCLAVFLLLIGLALGQNKYSRKEQSPKAETPHLSFVKEYIRELTYDEDLKTSGEKELNAAKSLNEQLSIGIYFSKSVQLELRTPKFHPLFGESLELAAQAREWGEERVYYRDPRGRMRYLPACWTSVGVTDPFVLLAADRAYFRLEDLIRLHDRIKELQGKRV